MREAEKNLNDLNKCCGLFTCPWMKDGVEKGDERGNFFPLLPRTFPPLIEGRVRGSEDAYKVRTLISLCTLARGNLAAKY